MTELAVWAPSAREVVVELLPSGRTVPMTGSEDGWFRASVALGHKNGNGGNGKSGTGGHSCDDRYWFRIDGDEPRPDPRSRWQPDGVHGPSQWFDASAHQWHDEGFSPVDLADAVIYELHVGTFSPEGTFTAAIERLDHLVELGITHVELLPVGAFAGRHGWGYDGVDLYAPHPAYGTPAELQALVDACHQHGLAVLLDVVYNHLGPEGNYLDRFGPYFTEKYRTPWGPAVNVDDRDSDEVRRFFIDNALMWLRDHHVDGLRLDAMHAVIDTSAVPFLEQLRTEVDALAAALGRRLVLIAEYEGNDPKIVRPQSLGGFGLDAHWNDDYHHAIHTALTGERTSYYEDYHGLRDVAEALQHGYVYHGRYSAHRRRRIGRPLTDVGGRSLVGFLQNHDHIGNRAGGERIGHVVSAARQKVGAALVFVSPFVPLLFQGEEWAASSPFPFFADHQDPELVEAVRRGRLQEFEAFGWDPAAVADPEDEQTFLSAKLRWEEVQRAEHADMLAWYRLLIALRRDRPELRDDHFERIGTMVDEPAGVLVVRRGPIIVAASLGSSPTVVALDDSASGKVLAVSDERVRVRDGGIHLEPDTVAIVETSAATDS